jgi:hypothetical protein
VEGAAERPQQRIVCAAQRHRDGRIVCGARHFDDLMWQQILQMTPAAWQSLKISNEAPPVEAQHWSRFSRSGFVNQFCEFLTREEAWLVAEAAGQIIRDRDWMTGRLHSEHLY